jgi:hypothetical protein
MNRKIIAPLISLLLVIGVAAAIYMSATEQSSLRNTIQVRGLVGSEKIPFFHDERVQQALKRNGLAVEVEKAGSRQIALRSDLKEYDFAFPAGVPAAEKIKREQQVHKWHPIFYTPMCVASWGIIAEILQSNGIVEHRENTYYIIDLPKLLGLINDEVRWSQLSNSSNYSVDKGVLITSTDVRKSNSAAMYLALASFILNNNTVVTTDEQIQQLMPRLSALFLRQGYVESSSSGPYNDYLVMGPGKSPLVMIYEAQFLHDAAAPDSVIQPEMVLMYPEPTVFTKHILLPFSDGGERLASVLLEDEVLIKLAVEYGFRNKNIQEFRRFVGEHNLAVPSQLVKVIEPPSYEILEGMIQQIEQLYEQQM